MSLSAEDAAKLVKALPKDASDEVKEALTKAANGIVKGLVDNRDAVIAELADLKKTKDADKEAMAALTKSEKDFNGRD